MYTIKLWHVIHISRKKVRLEQKCIVLEHTYTLKLFLTSFSLHAHSGLFRASMTAWSCDAESDKLISKSLWYWEKRENKRERERE